MATYSDSGVAHADSLGSDVFYDNICQPCRDDGKVLEAEGRCEDCDEFLCKTCFQYHALPRPTRHHVLIGKDQMKGTASRKDQCTEKCPKHDDEIIKYYCPTHTILGCNACMILNHKYCEGTVYIPEVAKYILNSEEYRKYKASKSAIESKTRATVDDAKERVNTINDTQTAAVEKMRSFKIMMIHLFEKAENELIEESKHIQEEEVKKQNAIQEKCGVVEKEMTTLTSSVERFESKQQYCNMYTALMKIQDRMQACGDKLNEINNRDEAHMELYFTPKFNLIDEVSSKNGTGTLTLTEGITEVKHDRDIEVKTHGDANTCWISGSAILPGNKLVIVDCNNDKLKLVDIAQNKVVEELPMPPHPWDVTAVISNEIAVTLTHKKKIAFVKVDGNLVKDREVVVDGDCRGVAYNDGKLVVTFYDPPKVVLMDMQGVVLQTIATNEVQKDLLKDPIYVDINPVNKTIYVSDGSAGKVVHLDANGTKLSTYIDSDLKYCLGMAVDSQGNSYVCDWKHNIHQLTKDCKKRRILLTKADVTKPYTISFSDLEDRLYVGMRGNTAIKVFKVQ